MTIQNMYDHVNRLTGALSVAFGGGGSALNFNYQYNAASQRTPLTLFDASHSLYGCGAQGQLAGANKFISEAGGKERKI